MCFIHVLEFHIVLFEILLTTCADQLLYNLRSQEILESSHLKNVFFFLLYIVETSYGNAYIKFLYLRTSDNDIIWLKIKAVFLIQTFFH